MNIERLKELLSALAMGRRDVVAELAELIAGKTESEKETKKAPAKKVANGAND